MMLDPQAESWMSDAQRQLLLALLAGALCLGLVGWLMPPAGPFYWIVLGLAPAVAMGLGWKFGGTARGRRLDWLLLGRIGPPAPTWAPTHPGALTPEMLAALESAVVPMLLGGVADAARTAPPSLAPQVQSLLATARGLLRQPQPPAAVLHLLATHLPGVMQAVDRVRQGAAEACTLLESALHGTAPPDWEERMAGLLTTPFRRKDQFQ